MLIALAASLLGAAAPIEDAEVDAHSGVVAYLCAIDRCAGRRDRAECGIE